MSIYDKQCGCCKKEPAFSWVEERHMWVCKKCFDQIELHESTPEFREDARACLVAIIAKDKFSMEDNVHLAIIYAEELEKQLKERGRL